LNYFLKMQKSNPKKIVHKPQHQPRPGIESRMHPEPVYDYPGVKGTGKLKGKTAVITGGDSGIGRAVAVLFAKEGADITIIYLNEDTDAKETKRAVEEYGRKCLLISGDIAKEKFCISAIKKVHKKFKEINILVNNAAIHYEHKNITEIKTKQLVKTFETNVFSMFYLTKAAIEYMPPGSSIINTTSVVAYRGSPALMDYAASKGAIVSFTRSLSANLADKKIRVNAVAPGPVWTPLIVSSFKAVKAAKHGSDSPMKRPGEPVEIAPCYLLLASDDSSFMSGQVLHPNGGEIVNG
jgi:NAD(P)-dependent dehydrogenase (short-subunit alcohol dehydrogenase family)